jgi:GNAT superfamily N-acetyltransferase
MTSPPITTATKPDQQQRAVATIVTAFTADKVSRWVLPEPHQYLTYFTEFVPLMAAGTFDHGGAYCTDDFGAASLWLPPNVHSDYEAMAGLAQKAVAERDQEKVFAFMGQMGEYHPTEPHWYLPFIGVDPLRQGEGLGSALLKHALQNCDHDKLPAYLEATSPGSRRLYERHGFEAIGEIQTADSPSLWPMLRRPR